MWVKRRYPLSITNKALPTMLFDDIETPAIAGFFPGRIPCCRAGPSRQSPARDRSGSERGLPERCRKIHHEKRDGNMHPKRTLGAFHPRGKRVAPALGLWRHFDFHAHAAAWLQGAQGAPPRSNAGLARIVDPSTSHGERRYFIVHLVCRLRSRALPESVLEDLFKLTRREIEIVARLSRSEQLRLIAVNMKISHETVRTYLKRVLRKCGVKSQAELLCLTQQLSLFHHVGVSGG
jgi:DNA-binding CsgD family transcriptional regulator